VEKFWSRPGTKLCRAKNFAKNFENIKSKKARPCHNNEGCIRHKLKLSGGKDAEKVCSIHAEVNAIAKAARQGIKIDGATMFTTSFPCLICIRAIIAAGIKKVIYMNDFYQPHHLKLFSENEIDIQQIPETEVWENK